MPFFDEWEKEIVEASCKPSKLTDEYSGCDTESQMEIMAVTSLIAAWIPMKV